MSAKMMKICPSCKAENDASAIECKICGMDLVSVSPRNTTAGNAPKSPVRPSSSGSNTAPGQRMIKLCPECRNVNSPQAQKCGICGESLIGVLPSVPNAGLRNQPSAGKQAPVWKLISVNGAYQYAFPADKNTFMIGREAEMADFLSNHLYVSRQQAELTVTGKEVSIRNVSRSNPTFVNNEALEHDAIRKLNENDEIGLGGKVIDGKRQPQAAYFILKVKA